MSVLIDDPFNAPEDPKMPFLRRALDPQEVLSQLQSCCTALGGGAGRARLESIKVIRHKPGRRCLVEYELSPEPTGERFVILGKARSKGLDKKAPALIERLRNSGFNEKSQICVPQPLGVIPDFRMWLQRKIRGVSFTELLAQPDAVKWAIFAAEAAHKIHQANIPTQRAHSIADELTILKERLSNVAVSKAELKTRIDRVISECKRLAEQVPALPACGIHRDYYPAQIIAERVASESKTANVPRVYITDFDLYCMGDPGLDIGNFLAHMTEQSLRQHGNPTAFVVQERALKDRFLELAGTDYERSVEAYCTFTLARHIYLSCHLPDRQHLTGLLLDLTEKRLGLEASA